MGNPRIKTFALHKIPRETQMGKTELKKYECTMPQIITSGVLTAMNVPSLGLKVNDGHEEL